MDRWVEQVRAEGIEAERDEVVPVGLYADGAPFTSKASVYVLTMNLLRGDQRRWVITSFSSSHLCSCGCRGAHTLQKLFRVLVWSFTCRAGR